MTTVRNALILISTDGTRDRNGGRQDAENDVSICEQNA